MAYSIVYTVSTMSVGITGIPIPTIEERYSYSLFWSTLLNHIMKWAFELCHLPQYPILNNCITACDQLKSGICLIANWCISLLSALTPWVPDDIISFCLINSLENAISSLKTYRKSWTSKGIIKKIYTNFRVNTVLADDHLIIGHDDQTQVIYIYLTTTWRVKSLCGLIKAALSKILDITGSCSSLLPVSKWVSKVLFCRTNFENHTFKIIGTSPRGQWVKVADVVAKYRMRQASPGTTNMETYSNRFFSGSN